MTEEPTWLTPLWHGRWRIYLVDNPYVNSRYEFVHDDYDGAEDSNDHRFGWAATIDQAKADIDEFESENAK